MSHRLSPAERQAVEEHKYYLSEREGRDVGFAYALADWEAHYAAKWRADRHDRCLEMQREEIKKYKWIESERARRDLGRKAAVDWVERHAAAWREWYDTVYDPEPRHEER